MGFGPQDEDYHGSVGEDEDYHGSVGEDEDHHGSVGLLLAPRMRTIMAVSVSWYHKEYVIG